MRAASCQLLVALLAVPVGLGETAHADEPAPSSASPRVAEARPLVLPTPEITTAGSTSGAASASISLSFLTAPPDGGADTVHGATISASTTTTDGLTKLFSDTLGDGKGATTDSAWKLALTYNLIGLQDELLFTRGDEGGEEMRTAVQACRDACVSPDPTGTCDAFLDENKRVTERESAERTEDILAAAGVDAAAPSPEWLDRLVAWIDPSGTTCPTADDALRADTEAQKDVKGGLAKLVKGCAEVCEGQAGAACARVVSLNDALHPKSVSWNAALTIDPDTLCEAGIDALRRSRVAVLNQSAIFPSYRVNLGASGGFSPQKYLFADAETSLLTDTSKLFGTASFGLSAMSLNSNTGLTVEALARYDYGVTPQSTTASWCVPAGDVAGADGATAPAETCKDRALGKPTQDHTIRGEVYAGWTDASVGRWRTSGGVRVDLNLGPDTTASTTVSLRLPTTVDLAAVERRNTADKLTYDGLIRFTPFVDLVFSDGQTTPKVGVELALLGRRSLFSSAFDSL